MNKNIWLMDEEEEKKGNKNNKLFLFFNFYFWKVHALHEQI